MSNTDTIVQVKSLNKKFGDRSVVNSVSFEVYKGECFGILGPNGAGKSTTMSILYGALSKTAGEAYVLGINLDDDKKFLRSQVGVVPQEDGLDPDFSLRENLLLYAGYMGVEPAAARQKVEELLRLMRLEDHADKMMDELSGGMRRRLALARGLLNSPSIIFLDEPTSGLDPQARLWIWDFLEKIKSEMGTVMLTTHYMEEAQVLCDRVAIMDYGKILCIGTPKELIRDYIGKEVIEVETHPDNLRYFKKRLEPAGYIIQMLNRRMNVYLQEGESSAPILEVAQGSKITMRPPTLNDVFLRLAGHELRQDIQ